jgi:hypothetical protein
MKANLNITSAKFLISLRAENPEEKEVLVEINKKLVYSEDLCAATNSVTGELILAIKK